MIKHFRLVLGILCGLASAGWAGPLERLKEEDSEAYWAKLQEAQENAKSSKQPLSGQEPQDQYVVEADSKYHTLHFSASDEAGNYYINCSIAAATLGRDAVTLIQKIGHCVDLTPANIALSENKKPQKIEDFRIESTPISLVVVLDITGSMGKTYVSGTGRRSDNFHLSLDTLVQLIQGPLGGDEFALAVVREEKFGPQLLIPEFTKDTSQIQSQMSIQSPNGMTPLFDTILKAGALFSRAHNKKKVMVIVSDWEENHSKIDLKKLKHKAKEWNAQIFTVVVPGAIHRYSAICHSREGSRKASQSFNDETESAEGKAERICSGMDFGEAPSPLHTQNTPQNVPQSDIGSYRVEVGCDVGTRVFKATPLYTLCDEGPEGWGDAKDFIERTGGRIFDATYIDFEKAFWDIYIQSRLQYAVGYQPVKIKKGAYNKVKIELVPKKQFQNVQVYVKQEIQEDE